MSAVTTASMSSRQRVEALYVALPNHLHAGYTVRALRAGLLPSTIAA